MTQHTLKTHYAALGVEPCANSYEIKLAYRAQALKCHPDKNGGTPEAKEAFQHLINGYEILSDETKRQAYDQTLPSAYFSPACSSRSKENKAPPFEARTSPTPYPSSFTSGWPNPPAGFTSAEHAARWRQQVEEDERCQQEEYAHWKKEEEERKLRRDEEGKGKDDEEQREKEAEKKGRWCGKESRKQRARKEQEAEMMATEALRVARELEGEEWKRREKRNEKGWGCRGDRSKEAVADRKHDESEEERRRFVRGMWGVHHER